MREAWSRLRGSARAAAFAAALVSLEVASFAQSPHDIARKLFGGARRDYGAPWTSCLALLALGALAWAAYYLHAKQGRRVARRDAERANEAVERIDGIVPADGMLRIGQSVQVEHQGPRSRRLYGSYIQEVTEHTVVLAAPRHDGVPVPIHAGELVGVIVRTAEGTYRLSGEVLERAPGAMPSLRIERHDRAERFQRRAFFRLPINIETRFEVYRRGLAPPTKLHRSGVITNLSASGCRLVTGVAVSKAQMCALEVRLPRTKGPLHVVAEIVGGDAGKAGRRSTWTLLLHFASMKPRDRERLVAYVRDLEIQRIRRQREREETAAKGVPRP